MPWPWGVHLAGTGDGLCPGDVWVNYESYTFSMPASREFVTIAVGFVNIEVKLGACSVAAVSVP